MKKALTRVGQQHFHVKIGPEFVDLYNNLAEPWAGPLFDVIIDDGLAAGATWINIINEFIEDFLDDEEQHIILEDIVDYLEMEHDPDCSGKLYFHLDEGIDIILEECHGCVPQHNN